ncbi:MAG: CAP domain-containing protein, partial [Ruminococcus sp.]
LENIKSLADEFPDDTAFADECDELYSDILREWINSQKSNENYFGDNGAVIIAYTYQFFDFEGGIDELKQEGFQCETKKLFDMINSHREQNGLPALEINSSMMDTAQLCADNYLQGESPNVEYNTDIIDRNTAEEIMQYHYTDKVHTSPFLESSTNIGIGISFNTENMKCAWIILT